MAVQMLGAQVMLSAEVAPLEYGPEALYAVGVRLIPDILTDALTDRLMIEGHAPVSSRLIRVDGSARGRDVLPACHAGVFPGCAQGELPRTMVRCTARAARATIAP